QGVSERLKRSDEGDYALDKSRSAIYPEGTMNFPQNSEFEATLTFRGSNPGRQVRSVTPTASAITVRQHHSFVQLPDDNFKPRRFDPRAGYFSISYQDYSMPIGQPLTKRFIPKHRLKHTDPEAEMRE